MLLFARYLKNNISEFRLILLHHITMSLKVPSYSCRWASADIDARVETMLTFLRRRQPMSNNASMNAP